MVGVVGGAADADPGTVASAKGERDGFGHVAVDCPASRLAESQARVGRDGLDGGGGLGGQVGQGRAHHRGVLAPQGDAGVIDLAETGLQLLAGIGPSGDFGEALQMVLAEAAVADTAVVAELVVVLEEDHEWPRPLGDDLAVAHEAEAEPRVERTIGEGRGGAAKPGNRRKRRARSNLQGGGIPPRDPEALGLKGGPDATDKVADRLVKGLVGKSGEADNLGRGNEEKMADARGALDLAHRGVHRIRPVGVEDEGEGCVRLFMTMAGSNLLQCIQLCGGWMRSSTGHGVFVGPISYSVLVIRSY